MTATHPTSQDRDNSPDPATDPAHSGASGTPVSTTRPVRSPRNRRRRRVLMAAVVAVLCTVGGYLWLNAPATLALTGETDCADVPVHSTIRAAESEQVHAGVCTAMAAISKAWADHDADAYGQAFTANATYTTFAGTHYQGRTDIVDSHDALFDGVLEGTELADAFLALDILTEEVAVLTTRGDTYEGSVPDRLTKVQTYTSVRVDDQWLVASFHNTQRQEAMERIQFLWMPGSAPAGER